MLNDYDMHGILSGENMHSHMNVARAGGNECCCPELVLPMTAALTLTLTLLRKSETKKNSVLTISRKGEGDLTNNF